MARSAAERSKKTPASIDYLVALGPGPGGAQNWTVFLKNGGGSYFADAQGTITRRLG